MTQKTLAEAVSDSRRKTGATQTTLTLRPEEAELLERLAAEHGGKKAAILAGLEALVSRQEPTNAELLALLERRLGG